MNGIPIASTRDVFTDFARYDKILPGYTLNDYYYAPFEAVGKTTSGIERLLNFVKDQTPLVLLPDVEIPSIHYAINFSLYKDGLYTYQVCSDSYPSYEIYYKPPGARSYFRTYKYTHPDLPTIVGIREVFERLQSPNCDVMTTTGVMSPPVDGRTYNPFADFPGPE